MYDDSQTMLKYYNSVDMKPFDYQLLGLIRSSFFFCLLLEARNDSELNIGNDDLGGFIFGWRQLTDNTIIITCMAKSVTLRVKCDTTQTEHNTHAENHIYKTWLVCKRPQAFAM